MRCAILGGGAVGTAFAFALARRGAPLVLWSRRAERARALRARLAAASDTRAPHAEERLEMALAHVDAVLLPVADEAIVEVAERCAAARTVEPGRTPPVALHHAGAFGPEHLAVLARHGWSTGKLHPLAAVPPAGEVEGALSGAWFAVAGAPRARAVASALVRWVGGKELALADGVDVSRTYHAAAALLAGGVVALVDASEEVLAPCLADPTQARPALLALLETAIRPLAGLGAEGALAGPVARGSVEVVAGHLDALRARDPRLARTYALLAARMLALAVARGTVDPARRAALERLLGAE